MLSSIERPRARHPSINRTINLTGFSLIFCKVYKSIQFMKLHEWVLHSYSHVYAYIHVYVILLYIYTYFSDNYQPKTDQFCLHWSCSLLTVHTVTVVKREHLQCRQNESNFMQPTTVNGAHPIMDAVIIQRLAVDCLNRETNSQALHMGENIILESVCLGNPVQNAVE